MLAYTFYENDNRVRRYAEALVKRGDAVDVVAVRQAGQPAYTEIEGVHVYRIQERVLDERGPLSYLVKLTKFFFRSAGFVTRRQFSAPYSVIHVHSVPDFEVFAALIPRLMGAKVILDIHDIVPEFYACKFHTEKNSLLFRVLVLIEKLSILFSSHVIIANHIWYNRLTQRSVRAGKCTTIINYPDPAIFHPRPRTTDNDGKILMLYPGTINHHQGLDVAVRAMALLRDKIPSLQLHLVGDGPDRAMLQAMVKDLNLEDRVIFRGMLPLEKVAEVMANVDLGVVPKRTNSFGNEAFSTKIPEFMAMGVPVAASRTQIDQYYFNDEMIQFFESDNPEDLAEKIVLLIRNQDRRNSLCEHALAYIDSNNWNVKKYEYLDLVDRLTGRQASPVVDD